MGRFRGLEWRFSAGCTRGVLVWGDSAGWSGVFPRVEPGGCWCGASPPGRSRVYDGRSSSGVRTLIQTGDQTVTRPSEKDKAPPLFWVYEDPKHPADRTNYQEPTTRPGPQGRIYRRTDHQGCRHQERLYCGWGPGRHGAGSGYRIGHQQYQWQPFVWPVWRTGGCCGRCRRGAGRFTEGGEQGEPGPVGGSLGRRFDTVFRRDVGGRPSDQSPGSSWSRRPHRGQWRSGGRGRRRPGRSSHPVYRE